MRLIVALKQRNLDEMKKVVSQVSDPSSPSYGQYLTIEQIAEKMAPTTEEVDRVMGYFQQYGATSIQMTKSGDFMTVEMPVLGVEQAFKTRLYEWKHIGSSRVIIRADERPATPAEIKPHVDLVLGLHDFLDHASERRAASKLQKSAALTGSPAVPCENTTAPEVLSAKGSESDLSVTIKLYCSDALPARDAFAPCSASSSVEGAGRLGLSAITGVTVTFAPRGYDTVVTTFLLEQLQCSARGDGVSCVTPLQKSLPAYSRVHVSAVSLFADGSRSASGSYGTDHALTSYILPATIYSYYGVPQGYRATHPNNSQAVTAFEEQYISDSDLRSFYSLAGLPYQAPEIRGENDPSQPGGESTLDIQYIMGVGAGVPTVFWSVTGPGPAKPPGQGAYVLEWALQVSNTTNAPLVTSISYGDTEDGYFAKFGDYSYIDRTNVELMKMALRGLTVIAGSGDAGVSNVGEEGNDISDTDPACTPFRPFFPSNSPYVTSLSSTFLATVDETSKAIGEIAVGVSQGAHWTTGGGFSNLSSNPTAEWQFQAVTDYMLKMKDQLPPTEHWNPEGRGYPDISTLGHNLLVVWGNKTVPIGGTSASGPVFAGLVSLLNDERLHNGLPPMGLINPFLYKAKQLLSDAIFDVTIGHNFDGDLQPRCSAFDTYCPYGFKTAAGWNPVNGLGTPNWAVLKELALNPAKFA